MREIQESTLCWPDSWSLRLCNSPCLTMMRTLSQDLPQSPLRMSRYPNLLAQFWLKL
jgi:hypothetical protein